MTAEELDRYITDEALRRLEAVVLAADSVGHGSGAVRVRGAVRAILRTALAQCRADVMQEARQASAVYCSRSRLCIDSAMSK